MKTKEEVKEFVASLYFSRIDAERVMGFLLGKGLVEKGEIVNFGICNSKKLETCSFEEFYAWFEDEDTRLEDLMNFLQDEQDKALYRGEIRKVHKMAVFLGFLVEELGLEYDEVEEKDE